MIDYEIQPIPHHYETFVNFTYEAFVNLGPNFCR